LFAPWQPVHSNLKRISEVDGVDMSASQWTIETAAGILLVACIGIGSGCVTGREGATSDADSATSGPRPSGVCQQYLALLSEERRQPLLAEYGSGGSCWTTGKPQEQQCNDTCSQGVNQIIRTNLHQSDS
jgi:hypothetical protein